jgi:DNA-binding response OmpR family regulator
MLSTMAIDRTSAARTSPGRILVIEDDPAIRQGVVTCLELEAYAVTTAIDASSGRRAALHGEHDLILLDLVLPGGDGLDLLAEIRRLGHTVPVIIMTARGAETDRVRGLRGGADDYVVKPFGTAELLARVAAVLRRSVAAAAPLPETIAVPGGVLDLGRREARLTGLITALSEQEAAVLHVLAQHRDRAVTREELLVVLAGGGGIDRNSRAADMLLARLRSKLGTHGDTVIRTVRGCGYQLGLP